MWKVGEIMEKKTKDRIDPKSMETKDTIDEIPIEKLPLLETTMNIEGDSIVKGFMVVEKHTDKYDENSFGSFLRLPKTSKVALLSNRLDNILDNMIQPLIDQPHEITDRDVETLVTITRIEEPREIDARPQVVDLVKPIPQYYEY